MHFVWRDLGQRLEDELSLMHQRMRDDQAGVVNNLIVKKEQVEVDGARSPFFAAMAAEALLDFQQLVEQLMGIELGVQLSGGVKKRRRVGGTADGGVFQERGNPGDAEIRQSAQSLEGAAQGMLAISEIRTKGDVGNM